MVPPGFIQSGRASLALPVYFIKRYIAWQEHKEEEEQRKMVRSNGVYSFPSCLAKGLCGVYKGINNR
jgi:hypothetical protein